MVQSEAWPGLLEYSEALEIVLTLARPLGLERIGVSGGLGRVLAEDVFSLTALPRFDNSAVDGYGIREEDRERLEHGAVGLRCIGLLAAGAEPARFLPGPGECVQIMTGARIPTGVTAVVMQEDVERIGDTVHLASAISPGEHIRRRADDFDEGAMVLAKGSLLDPGSLSALASVGCCEVSVWRRPRVSILATGSELRRPGEPLGESGVYESNSIGLASALQAMGIDSSVQFAEDDESEIEGRLARLLEASDVVLTTGGVSVGQLDHVKPILSRLGVETHFSGVAMKPGKPVLFGTRARAAVFGLPGNPLSSLIGFCVLVRPYLLATLGLEGKPKSEPRRLAASLRKKRGRAEFVPGHVVGGEVRPWVGRASHRLSGIAGANALIVLSADADGAEVGSEVEVLRLQWSLP